MFQRSVALASRRVSRFRFGACGAIRCFAVCAKVSENVVPPWFSCAQCALVGVYRSGSSRVAYRVLEELVCASLSGSRGASLRKQEARCLEVLLSLSSLNWMLFFSVVCTCLTMSLIEFSRS